MMLLVILGILFVLKSKEGYLFYYLPVPKDEQDL